MTLGVRAARVVAGDGSAPQAAPTSTRLVGAVLLGNAMAGSSAHTSQRCGAGQQFLDGHAFISDSVKHPIERVAKVGEGA